MQRQDWLARLDQPDRTVRRGRYRRRADFEASRTDPDASLMVHKGGGLRVGYHDHYVVDGGTARIILAALVTPADVMENQPALDLIWRTGFRWHLRPRHVTGDTTYGTAEIGAGLEGQHIRAYVPLPAFDERTGLYGKGLFRYDAERECYVCPQGAALLFRWQQDTTGTRLYQASAATCYACAVKAACTRSRDGRRINRSDAEAELDRVRSYHQTEPYRKARRKHQVWVEPLFAEAKQWHGLERFRLRGLPKVNGEALLTAAGQNVKRLLSRRGWGRRPWPSGAAGLRLPAGPAVQPIVSP